MKHRLHKTRSLLLLILLALPLAACRTADSSDTPLAQLPATATATVTAVSEAASPIPATDTAAPQSPTAPPTSTPPPTLPPTATSLPTTTPTPSPTLPPTETPAPTETATITPTATPEPPPLPEWLTLLNRLRQMAGVKAVTDWEPYTIGSKLHSHYMVINDAAIAHSQDPANPHFDPAGDQAARNGNIFATSQLDANYLWSINFWASAPFHLIGMLDPNLNHVGYGDYVEDGGDVAMAAVLDIGSDPGADNGVTYPVIFPGPNSSTWIVRHSLYEWPDPIASCPGYTRPAGAPIVLFLGDGRGTPQVESHRLALGDVLLETCLFDETSYRNPDPYAEKVGRTILSHNNAVVIIPRAPLAADATYTAQVTADGQTYTWQFNTIKRPD